MSIVDLFIMHELAVIIDDGLFIFPNKPQQLANPCLNSIASCNTILSQEMLSHFETSKYCRANHMINFNHDTALY